MLVISVHLPCISEFISLVPTLVPSVTLQYMSSKSLKFKKKKKKVVSITEMGMGFVVRTWRNSVLFGSMRLSAACYHKAVCHTQLQCVFEVLPKTSLFS